MNDLTQEQLKELLHYDPLSGIFTWRVNRGMRGRAGSNAGSLNKGTGYRNIIIFKRSYKEHRLVWLYMTGSWPVGVIDHANRETSDNRWLNLRDVSIAENKQNTSVRRDSRSGIKGVSRSRNGRAWIASICVLGKNVYLGYFKTIEDAISAYSDGAAKFHKINPASDSPTTSSRT